MANEQFDTGLDFLQLAKIDLTGTGDLTLVATVTGKVIRAFKLFLVFSAATTISFKRGSTALTGNIAMPAGGSIVLDADLEKRKLELEAPLPGLKAEVVALATERDRLKKAVDTLKSSIAGV